MNERADVLVIGSGIAGLTFALKTARYASVLLITKKQRAETNTNYAQGGIAAVLGPDDSALLHVRDTLSAGAGLCHREAVERLVREGPQRIRELIEWGTRFHEEGGRLALGMEGGHTRRRIAHAADRTGQEIERALLEAVEGEPNIHVLEDHLALDFLIEEDAVGRARCAGARTLDHVVGRVVDVHARATMLASGGCGQVYRHTTNPSIATGDGVAMAYRAGARVANMEFIQFHPTALYPTEDPAFLISEALRGEGAVLRRLDGAAFMDDYDARGSLAPRDVVARAIDAELKRTGDAHVLLDVSPIAADVLAERFPGAVAGCRERGIDLDVGIPVVPAAHYMCGGVVTDDEGATNVPGLYAAGEVGCTGVHGANRLASNSLLEAVVFSHRAAGAVVDRLGAASDGRRSFGPGAVEERTALGDASEPEIDAQSCVHERGWLRSLMWDLVGIVRSDERLERAEHEVTARLAAWDARWSASFPSVEAAELRNLLQTAELIIRCALRRRESRGLHYNVDHPGRDNEHFLRDTVVQR